MREIAIVLWIIYISSKIHASKEFLNEMHEEARPLEADWASVVLTEEWQQVPSFQQSAPTRHQICQYLHHGLLNGEIWMSAICKSPCLGYFITEKGILFQKRSYLVRKFSYLCGLSSELSYLILSLYSLCISTSQVPKVTSLNFDHSVN